MRKDGSDARASEPILMGTEDVLGREKESI